MLCINCSQKEFRAIVVGAALAVSCVRECLGSNILPNYMCVYCSFYTVKGSNYFLKVVAENSTLLTTSLNATVALR